MKTLKMAVFLFVIAVLSACSGGGSGGGSVVVPGSSTSTGIPAPSKAPVVANVNMDVSAGVATVITPTVSVMNGPAGSYSISIASLPQNGSVTVTDNGHSMTYISSSTFDGLDRFTFTVTDRDGLSTKASASLNVFPKANVFLNAGVGKCGAFLIDTLGDMCPRIENYGNKGDRVALIRTGREGPTHPNAGDDVFYLIRSYDNGKTFLIGIDSLGGPPPWPTAPLPALRSFVDDVGNLYYGDIYDGKAIYVTKRPGNDLGPPYVDIKIAPQLITFGGVLISGPIIHTLDLSGTLYTSSDTGATWSSFVPSTVQKIDSRVSLHKAPDGIIHIFANDTMSGFYHSTFDPVAKVLSSFKKITEALPVEADPYRKKDVLVFSGSCIYFPYKDASAGLHVLKSCDNGNNWIDVFVASNVAGALDPKGPFLQEAWMDPTNLDIYTIEESQNHKGYAYLAMRKYANGTWDQMGVDVTGLFPVKQQPHMDARLSLINKTLHLLSNNASDYTLVFLK